MRTSFRDTVYLYTIQEFAHASGDIPGLFGADVSVYDKCFQLLDILVEKIVDMLNEEEIRK